MKHRFVTQPKQTGKGRGERGGGCVLTFSELNVLCESKAVELGYNIIQYTGCRYKRVSL